MLVTVCCYQVLVVITLVMLESSLRMSKCLTYSAVVASSTSPALAKVCLFHETPHHAATPNRAAAT